MTRRFPIGALVALALSAAPVGSAALAGITLAGCGGKVAGHADAGPVDSGPPPLDSATVCVGNLVDYTRGELGAVAASGACSDAPDLDTICTVNISAVASSCGTSCFLDNASASNEELAACTTACVETMAPVRPAAPCVDCYVVAVECARIHCVSQCLFGNTPNCYACRMTNGCLSDFATCSGLPVPPAPVADAGMPDAGTDAGVGAGP